MILFSQAKKKALLLFFTIFSGGISGTGALSNQVFLQEEWKNREDKKELKNSFEEFYGEHQYSGDKKIGAKILKNIFKDSRIFEIFDRVQYLSAEKVVNEKNEILQLIKKKILEKLADRVKNRKIVGQFMYKLITDKFFLVIVRFRLDEREAKREWYYDWFSVKII